MANQTNFSKNSWGENEDMPEDFQIPVIKTSRLVLADTMKTVKHRKTSYQVETERYRPTNAILEKSFCGEFSTTARQPPLAIISPTVRVKSTDTGLPNSA